MDSNLLSGLMGLAGSLVGALAGYIAAMKAADKSYRHQLQLQQENNEGQIRGIVQAIHDELNELKEIYASDIGLTIQTIQEGQPLTFIFPLDQEYFTIYHSTAQYFGQIPDANLRRAIIHAYIGAKALVDTLRYNNRMWEEYDEAVKINAANATRAHELRRDELYKALVAYAPTIKSIHKDVLEAVALFNMAAGASGLLLFAPLEPKALKSQAAIPNDALFMRRQ